MKDRGTKRLIWTAALAISLVAVRAEAQTAGQAKAAQALAGQAKSGTSSATPSAPRASSAAVGASKTAAPAAGAKTAPSAPAASAKQVAPASGTPAGASAAQAVPAGVRRDPFRPLVIKGKGDELPARLPPGKPGLVIGQITIQGIVRGLDGRWIAVADNKTKRAYFLYVGDELYNGSVSRITENTVVFAERFTDPTGKQSSRDVVKQLAR